MGSYIRGLCTCWSVVIHKDVLIVSNRSRPSEVDD